MASNDDLRSRAFRLLDQEVRALATRLERVKPFALQETMVTAAAPSSRAQAAIEAHIQKAQFQLRRQIASYQAWLDTTEARLAPITRAQRRLTFLRLRFNAILSQFDIFADVMTQRSEHETGVWLRGLDEFAADALSLPGRPFDIPSAICYLDRGHGAAIRRTRTRLPGGTYNPVAIIRVPRERMIGGSGIGSSVAHEVGHQGAALLDLVNTLRPELRRMARKHGPQSQAWLMFERWISEIVADLWAVSRVGVAGPIGLIGVVSLPRVFVFRGSAGDPHPIPWIRVKLSCAMGKALYPDPQWDRLASIWNSFYPLAGLGVEQRQLFNLLESTVDDFASLLMEHRPEALRGASLYETLSGKDRRPAALRQLLERWRSHPHEMQAAPPSLALATLSQGKSDGILSPEAEAQTISRLLTYWAVTSALGDQASERPRSPLTTPATPPTSTKYLSGVLQ